MTIYLYSENERARYCTETIERFNMIIKYVLHENKSLTAGRGLDRLTLKNTRTALIKL